MLRLVLEQVFTEVFTRALEPIDRERVRRLVREAIDSDRPDLLREIVRELSFVAPLERSVHAWFDHLRPRDGGDPPAGSEP